MVELPEGPPKTRRPFSLRLAVVLLVVIGLSALSVGLELLVAERRVTTDGGLVAIAIPLGICVYSAAALVGGIGTWLRRRWAHRLALVTIAVGLAVLSWELSLIGLDPILLFGVATWGFVLALLLRPSVRSGVTRS